jgi:ribosomal protein S9
VLQKTAVAVAYAKPGKGLVKLNGEPWIGWFSGVVSSSKQQPATVKRAYLRQGDAKHAQQAKGSNTGLIQNKAGRHSSSKLTQQLHEAAAATLCGH